MSCDEQNQQPSQNRGLKRRRPGDAGTTISCSADPNAKALPPQASLVPPSPNDNGNDPAILEELQQALNILKANRSSSPALHVENNKVVQNIPGLVNRIISQGDGRQQHSLAVTELLLTIILDFVEPYVEDIVKDRNGNDKSCGKVTAEVQATQSKDKEYSEKYRDRAVSWAVERIRDLLRPAEITSTTAARTNIPELDALLSASGRMDGLRHECIVQEQLSQSIESMQPKLRNVQGTDKSDLTDIVTLLEKKKSGARMVDVSSSVISPDDWFQELTRRGDADMEMDEEGANRSMESFPYLGQMKDFIQRDRDS